MQTQSRIKTRYASFRDLPSISAVESRSAEKRCKLTAERIKPALFEQWLDRGHAVVSLGPDDEITGYAFHMLRRNYIVLKRIVVSPEFRRTGAGASMLDRIKRSLGKVAKVILCHVPQCELETHLFLRSQGFVAESLSDANRNDDTYTFVFPGD